MHDHIFLEDGNIFTKTPLGISKVEGQIHEFYSGINEITLISNYDKNIIYKLLCEHKIVDPTFFIKYDSQYNNKLKHKIKKSTSLESSVVKCLLIKIKEIAISIINNHKIEEKQRYSCSRLFAEYQNKKISTNQPIQANCIY